MKCVLVDRDSLDKGDLDFSCLARHVSNIEIHKHVANEQLLDLINNADIVISNKVILDRQTLSACENLKLICVAATGTNNIDIQAASELGIAVSNARAYATPSVTEHVFALILNLMRNLTDYQVAACDGHWSGSHEFCYIEKPIVELSGKVLGIVGYGELGKAVARLARAFGMTVLISQRPGVSGLTEGRLSLVDMLPQIDVLTLHCPLDVNTANLIDIKMLKLMKPEAILINTARGGIINEDDLVEALSNGFIAGAGIDVLEKEPPDVDNVLLNQAGLNLVITPHVAWASRESRQRLVVEICKNIESFNTGKVRNAVTA